MIDEEAFNVDSRDKNLRNCKEMIFEFFKDKSSTEVLGLIIDIYYDIIYAEPDGKAAKEKFVKVLYNLQSSKAINSLLKDDCVKDFKSFLRDFLDIGQESNNYYIGNEAFAQLSLYEFQSILIETKHHQLSTVDS